jgi:hypothetical protein
MPLVLEMKIHLKTDCCDNIEFVATGAMGNSQNWFGVFTDTVKLPLHEVVWAVHGGGISTGGLRFLCGAPLFT